MTYKSGEIYFVRETVLNSESLSPYVKIGLVADKRSSEERLKEHQTGNPRRLFNQEVIITDSVHRVEAQMHRLYAPKRVSGEWFEFDTEPEVLGAIEKVRELAHEMSQVTPIFLQAQSLANQPSVGDELEPNEKILEIVARWANAKSRMKHCEELEEEIKVKLKAAIASGADTTGVAKETSVTFKPKFSPSELKKDDESLWSKYVTYEPVWSSRFTNSIELVAFENLSPEFQEAFKNLKSRFLEISVQEAYLLNEVQLELTMLKALADWDWSLADAQLRIEVRDTPGIKGVCKWPRKAGTPKPVFDEESFASEHPELWAKYTLTKESFTKLLVSKSKK